MVHGLGFRVKRLGFKVQGSGSGIYGVEFWAESLSLLFRV